MRVTSDFWTSALLRRVFGAGGFAAVLRRGAAEAGAIFVVVRGRLDDVALFGPAPQAGYATGRPDERVFVRLLPTTQAEVDAKLSREERFDSDLWVMEIEPGALAVEELLTIMPA